ncbi:unnamed protein product, partial [Hapterophycus canaliculatus]
MAFEAIKNLKDRGGSSVPAIKKSITATYPELKFVPFQLRNALKRGTEAGKFVKVKGSYKLSAEAKKPPPKPKKVLKKKPVKKKVVKKKVVKKKVAKKKVAKKAASTAAPSPTPSPTPKASTPKKTAAAKKKTVTKKKLTPKKKEA